MRTSGISTGFPVLSQTSGQVAHVLLTRSPLGLHRYCYRMDPARLACVKHAASVRPEPGSNSPSRSRWANPPWIWRAGLRGSLPPGPTGAKTDVVRCQCIDVAIIRMIARTGFWLSSVPFSRSTPRSARVARRRRRYGVPLAEGHAGVRRTTSTLVRTAAPRTGLHPGRLVTVAPRRGLSNRSIGLAALPITP